MLLLSEDGRSPQTNDSLLSAFYDLARQTPDNDFLVEDVNRSLTYRESYILASQLLPQQLKRLCPSLSTPRRRKVVLISANNALVPLTLWAFWFMSFSVVPISVKSDQSLWRAMVDVVDPDAVIVSRNLRDAAAKYLPDTADLDVAYLDDIIPIQFALQISSLRQSDFIPSLKLWLSQISGPDDGHAPLRGPPHVDDELPVISLFTSSAVDASSLKSVTYTHTMLIHSACRMVEMLGGSPYGSHPIRHLGWLPLSHCFEFCISLLGIVLGTGGSYIFFDRQVSSPQAPLSTPIHVQLLHAIQYHQPVDSLCVVPAIFEDMVADLDEIGLRNLKAMRSLGVGGAPTSEDIFQWAAEHSVQYFDCSGATEAAGTICIRRVMVQSMRDHGLQVAPGLEGFLEKESLMDNFGELVLRGSYLPSGYDNKQSDAYQHDPVSGMNVYRTGDLYEEDEETMKVQKSSSYLKGGTLPHPDNNRPQLSGLKYLGRIDDLVVLASGVKIDALDIERHLNNHPLILRSAVISSITRETPVALLQPAGNNDTPLDVGKREKIVRYVMEINQMLSFEKRIRPGNIVFVDELPTTTKFTLNRKKVKKIWAELNGKWPVQKPQVADSHNHVSELREHVLLHNEVLRLLSNIFNIPVDHFVHKSVKVAEIPLTSITAVQLARALESQFSFSVTASQLYACKSVDDICDLIVKHDSATQYILSTPEDRSSSISETIATGNVADVSDASLVITGVACRYPGNVSSLSDLWDALLDPQTYDIRVSKKVPASRWSPESIQGVDIPPVAWLEDEAFQDTGAFRKFFRLSPADAQNMSPNARLVLRMAYQAIEDAGIAPSSLDGQSWAVFSSVNSSGWRERMSAELDIHEYSMALPGSAHDAVGARLSYFLNLTGPAIEVKTACSSSLVAINQACNSIRSGDCDAAIVVSSTTHFHPSGPIFRLDSGIASKSGRCATFSETADGFLPGEGAAAIVIQKATDAQCGVYAKIKASHITQDGRSHGFFAPNPAAQTRLLQQTMKKARCVEEDIDLIEAHGTGTQVGDAVEMQALDKVFRGKRTRPLLVSAVKAVLGHTEETAGLSSVLKTIACLQNNIVPGQHNLELPNSQIDFTGSKFIVPRRVTSFPRNGRPRRIGVSSFGLSGTLAHAILEDFDKHHVPQLTNTPSIFLISTVDFREYESLVKRCLEFVLSPSGAESTLKAICMTSQVGRDHFPVRRAWPVGDFRSLVSALSTELLGPKPRETFKHGNVRLGIWFGLPLPRASFDLPDSHVFGHKRSTVATSTWDQCYRAFAEQLAIVNALKALGCQIGAVGGEGMSEWVAAVCAGILPVDSVFQRRAEENNMVYLLRGPKSEITESLMQWLPSELRLRGCHTDELHVLEGEADVVEEFTKNGGYTVAVNPTLARAEPPSTNVNSKGIPFVSGYLCDVLDEDTLQSRTYWTQIANRVFDTRRGVECLTAKCDVVVHVGGPALALSSDKYTHFGSERFEQLLASLYEHGCDMDWNIFGTTGERVHLPVHQF